MFNSQYSLGKKTLEYGKEICDEAPDTNLLIFLPMTREEVLQFMRDIETQGYYRIVSLYQCGSKVFTMPSGGRTYNFRVRESYRGAIECILVLERSQMPGRYVDFTLEELEPFTYEVCKPLA